MTKIPLRIFLLLPLLLGLSGCAGVGRDVQWREPGTDLVWPEPPETPRIRFLRSISSPTELRSENRTQRLLELVTGSSGEEVPLTAPYGVAADGEGRIWITDSALGGVHFWDVKKGEADFFRSAGTNSFATPVGVAFDPRLQRLYVSDSTLSRVLVLDDRGRAVGDRVPPGGFARPGGVALDATGRLYVVDVVKGTVEIFNAGGGYVGRLGGETQLLKRPSNVAVDREGRVYVSDSMNFRVVAFGPDGLPVRTIGALGDVPGSFARPRGIALDSAGHLYVADAAFDTIQVFDREGKLLLFFGRPGKGAGEFCLPAGLHVDEADRLYVVDVCNYRIQLFQYLPASDLR